MRKDRVSVATETRRRRILVLVLIVTFTFSLGSVVMAQTSKSTAVKNIEGRLYGHDRSESAHLAGRRCSSYEARNCQSERPSHPRWPLLWRCRDHGSG